MLITVSDVRLALGDAYATYPDDPTIQSFITKREDELKELIGLDDLTAASYQNLLKQYLVNVVAMDVLRYDLLGKDSADSLDYTIGDLRENKSQNVKLKQQWIETFKESAEIALNTYFMKTIGYKQVNL